MKRLRLRRIFSLASETILFVPTDRCSGYLLRVEQDKLTFKWWHFVEAGTWSGNVDIANSETATATVTVPSGSEGKTIHIILEVTDDGSPPLTRYRRIIITPGS